MQHFGIPTRLLDLTKNPLIGLYFACENNFEQDGALYIFKENRKNILNFNSIQLECFEKLIKNKDAKICEECNNMTKQKCEQGKEIIKRSYFIKGFANNDRINNQSGSFIFSGIDDKNNKKSIDKLDELIKNVFIIDSKIKKDVLLKLKELNIHSGTVYPDLSNMSLYLKSEIENRPIIKEDIQEEENKNFYVTFRTEIEKLKKILKNDKHISLLIKKNTFEDFKKSLKNEFDKKLIKMKNDYKTFHIAVYNEKKVDELFNILSDEIFKENK